MRREHPRFGPLHPCAASSGTLPVSWALAFPLTLSLTLPIHLCSPHPLLYPSSDPYRERRAPAGCSPLAARRQQLLGFLLGPCQGEATSVPPRPTPRHLDLPPLWPHPFPFPPHLHPRTSRRPSCSKCTSLEKKARRKEGDERDRGSQFQAAPFWA